MKLLAKFIAVFVFLVSVPAMAATHYTGAPVLQNAVKAGKLPPVAERLPENPRVINLAAMGRKPGRHGGTWRMLIGKAKDIKLIPLYGYARLVGFNEKFELEADILQSYNVKEGRIFTFYLRKGHKWSDGQPFTTEDFRYAWEDMLNDKRLARSGLRDVLLVDGKGPKFEIIDETTVRYTWDAPNPNFLPSLAAPIPIYLAMPAHYLKQFHVKYQSTEKLVALLKKNRVKKWEKLHKRMAREKRASNPKLPTLAPWVNTIAPPSDLFVFKRNPFFHRVDENGNQLPYFDEITLAVGTGSLIPAKAGAGDADIQARNLNFVDYTHLKLGEKRNNYTVRLWKSGKGSAVTLLPNLNVKDPQWRATLRDVRFRRALSLGINRYEINQILFFGLARISGDTMLPQSPLYDEKFQKAWSRNDPKMANQLLDEMGLVKRDSEGFRLFPGGERIDIIVETAGEDTLQSDILELIQDQWQAIGLKLIIRGSQRDVMRRRAIAGLAIMTIWNGLDNAVASPDMSPFELIPSSQSSLQWPQWGIYYESDGKKGEKPDLPAAIELLEYSKKWTRATSSSEKAEIWKKILEIYSDQVFSIGIVNGALQPIIVNNQIQNVPEKAIYAYSPTSYFGVYLPDTFWFKKQ
ncbi:ABC transporter, substrate-binding protein (cluster 5, nickel/peptides/opines) [hydrothermal vent metagenome]|uniref:ABC transporter, substrate-binding protein (Cluster 5, nickel/peptides/opines) n=1 Tax=hydrothermal vent metagenome TaxID=652676 RepID=A0A3B0RZR7_9ZZZZ